MPTVLITGAGRGLGLELAKQYAEDGWTVHGTVRTDDAARQLASIGGAVTVHRLDVTDEAQIAGLASTLKAVAIDVLICNAGIYGERGVAFRDLDYRLWAEVFRVNVFGPTMIASALLENVAHSSQKKIITISSVMGSIARSPGSEFPYRSSKAAVNAVMKNLSVYLAPRDVIVAMLHPGWVRTDMGGTAADIAPEESVSGMRGLIARLTMADTGRFLTYEGTEIPW